MNSPRFTYRPIPTGLPVAVCPGCCAFYEIATRRWAVASGFKASVARWSGRSVLDEAHTWMSNTCPLCGTALVKHCVNQACNAHIIEALDSHCRQCGTAYPWFGADPVSAVTRPSQSEEAS